MKAYLQPAALAATLILAGAADAHVGGRGGGGARGGFGGGRVAAPHYSGGGGFNAGAGNRVGYASAGNVGNRNVGGSNFGRFDGNRTNIGNNTNIGNRNTQIGNNNINRTNIGNTNVGNRTNIGRNDGNLSGNRIGNNTINSGTRIGNTTIGSNSGNRTVNNIQGGNRGWTNTGNITGRETNVTNVNRTTNVNAAGRGGWGGWHGYHGGWGAGGWGPGAWNRPGGWGWNRPWAGGYGWYRGGWRGWSAWPTVWAGGAVAAPIVYSNPYYVPVPVGTSAPAPVVIQSSTTYAVPPALDYSRPIQAPSQQDVDKTDTDVVKAAQAHLDAGRASYKKGDYRAALVEADKAIELLPGDANSHEFRALCLFAQKKYTDAAATIYAVLTNGPGWDYGTVSSFYADAATYQKQLRDLEAFTKANPKDAAGHFLLAYHYLVQDERPQALDQLRTVEKLQPKDQLARSIAEALEKDQKQG